MAEIGEAIIGAGSRTNRYADFGRSRSRVRKSSDEIFEVSLCHIRTEGFIVLLM